MHTSPVAAPSSTSTLASWLRTSTTKPNQGPGKGTKAAPRRVERGEEELISPKEPRPDYEKLKAAGSKREEYSEQFYDLKL
jgi:hypothetical protein